LGIRQNSELFRENRRKWKISGSAVGVTLTKSKASFHDFHCDLTKLNSKPPAEKHKYKFTKAVLASWTQTSLQKRKSKAGPVVPGDSTTQEMCESCRAATKGK